MDEEVTIQARRQAALLYALGMPGAAAEIETFVGLQSNTDSELDAELQAVLQASTRDAAAAARYPQAG